MAEQDSYMEARRRVEEMQRRSRGYIAMQNPRIYEESQSNQRPAPPPEPPHTPTSRPPENLHNQEHFPQEQHLPQENFLQEQFAQGQFSQENQEHFPMPTLPSHSCPPAGDFPPKKGFLGGLLDTLLPGLAVDEERLLLLLLLIILAKNGSDIKLLLALGYLLL